MSMETPGATWHNSSWPFAGLENTVNKFRENRAQFRQTALLQNHQQAFQARENAAAGERHRENIVLQGKVNAILSDQSHGHLMQQMDKKYGQDKGLAIHAGQIAAIRADQDHEHTLGRIRTQGTVDRLAERLKHKNAFGDRSSQFDALMEASGNPNVHSLSIAGSSLTTREPQGAPESGGTPKPKRSRKSAPPQQ